MVFGQVRSMRYRPQGRQVAEVGEVAVVPGLQRLAEQRGTEGVAMTQGLFPERREAYAVGRFKADGPEGYRAASKPDAPVRATREQAEADERDHLFHDYGSNGRCRIEGCDVYDPTEDDDRIAD